MTALLSLLLGSPVAEAGKCDSYIKKADSAKGDALVSAFKSTLKCDQQEAQAAFPDFMKASGDVGTLVALSMAAIDAKAYTPVWEMLEKVPDYSAREETAKGIGTKCADNAEVVTFLKGAYYGLRARQFGQWQPALLTCESPDLVTWLEELVIKPPDSPYDEKYNAVITPFTKKKGPDALPVLERAAVEAGTKGGPFNTVLEKMDAAVDPPRGKQMDPEHRKALEASLVKVAGAVGPEQAASVADRLYNAGAEKAAASLLPVIYPERVQNGGRMLYGAASLEQCDKQLIIHFAPVIEPSKRWSIMADVEAPTRAFKKRLKCDSGEWAVVATPDPVASKGDINDWVDKLSEEWSGKGFSVKLREEKTITLN